MTQARILVADDDRAVRTVLSQALARDGHDVRTTGDAATLWQWVQEGEGDLIITGVVMSDETGLDLIPRIKRLRPQLRVIVMSAQNTLRTAVKATERGAFEYLSKPFDLDELLRTVRRALAAPAAVVPAAVQDQDQDQDQDQEEEQLPLIGRSPAMQDVSRALARLVATDLTTLIHGESGTGKELVARALHDFGRRRQRPFVALNMAAIPRELIESELFGHERGAFAGAAQRYAGRFEQAAGGTLFLDEIGNMPLEVQTRLLRVLQEGEFTAIGGRLQIRADVRIVVATRGDLQQMVRSGLFRDDLFYRLSVVPIRLPPLRERAEDIPELARHFFAEARKEGLPPKSFDAAALEYLKRYRWPGNIRELENLVLRLAALYSQEVIGVEVARAELSDVPEAAAEPQAGEESLGAAVERLLRDYFDAHADGLPASGLYERVLREVETPLLQLALSATGGNQLKAAQVLGLNRNTLRKKIRELNIEVLRGFK